MQTSLEMVIHQKVDDILAGQYMTDKQLITGRRGWVNCRRFHPLLMLITFGPAKDLGKLGQIKMTAGAGGLAYLLSLVPHVSSISITREL